MSREDHYIRKSMFQMSHPDYLGHTEFVSDANGDAYQYFWYSPFGDAIVEEHANTASFSSRYLFNAKELDPETGRYYYGARYYDPGLSIWLSVDPLAAKYPSLTPYNFVENNPINLIDPDGRNAWKPDGDGGWIAEPGDGAESLARDAGISREEAYSTLEEQGHGTYVDPDDGVLKSNIDPGDRVTVTKPILSEPDLVMSDEDMAKVNKYESKIAEINKQKEVTTSILKDKELWYQHFRNGPGSVPGFRRSPKGTLDPDDNIGVELGYGFNALRLELKIRSLKKDTSESVNLIRQYLDSINMIPDPSKELKP